MLISQLRKQRMAHPLLRLVEAIVAERKSIEDSWSSSGVKHEKAKVSVGGTTVEADEAEDKEELAGLSNAVSKSIAKLKADLDPMRVSKSTTSERELLTAILACLEHPLAEAHDTPPTEIAEALFACPALGVKYVEVSCKTNHQIHLLERLVLRALRLLPTPDAALRDTSKRKAAKAGEPLNPLDMLGQSLSSLFGGGSACVKERSGGG